MADTEKQAAQPRFKNEHDFLLNLYDRVNRTVTLSEHGKTEFPNLDLRLEVGECARTIIGGKARAVVQNTMFGNIVAMEEFQDSDDNSEIPARVVLLASASFVDVAIVPSHPTLWQLQQIFQIDDPDQSWGIESKREIHATLPQSNRAQDYEPSVMETFERTYESQPDNQEISIDADEDGYFNSHVRNTEQLENGVVKCGVDGQGRRFMIQGTPLGNVIVFERYSNVPDHRNAIVCNASIALQELFFIEGTVNYTLLVQLFPYDSNQNVGNRLAKLLQNDAPVSDTGTQMVDEGN